MNILSLFINPVDAIMDAKKNRSMGTTMMLLLLISLFAAILVGVMTAMSTGSYSYYGYNRGMNIAAVATAAFGAFIGVLLVDLFVGFLYGTIMRTLGGTGGFFEGLTAVAYSQFIQMAAFMVMVVLMALGSLGGGIGIAICSLLGMIILLWGFALGMATLYRALKELFSTDMITALVGVMVLLIPVILIAIMSSMWGIGSMMYRPMIYY